MWRRPDKIVMALRDEGSNLSLSPSPTLTTDTECPSPTVASLARAVQAPLIDAQAPSWMTQRAEWPLTPRRPHLTPAATESVLLCATRLTLARHFHLCNAQHSRPGAQAQAHEHHSVSQICLFLGSFPPSSPLEMTAADISTHLEGKRADISS